MEFKNLRAQREIGYLLLPTEPTYFLVYHFYPSFSDISERDGLIMKERIRAIMDKQERTPELEHKFQMYYYCDALMALRNIVMHNGKWEPIEKFYNSFVDRVIILYDYMLANGEKFNQNSKETLGMLINRINIIHPMIPGSKEIILVPGTIIEVPNEFEEPIIGETYNLSECRDRFGLNMKKYIIRINKNNNGLEIEGKFVKWNGVYVMIRTCNTNKNVPKKNIKDITILERLWDLQLA